MPRISTVLLVLAAILRPGSIGAVEPSVFQQNTAANGDVRGDGDVGRGRTAYLDYGCYACHGYSGQNGPGARLVGSPRMSAPATFIQYVRNPSRMPAYSTEVLADGELMDMYAFIRTLEDSPPAGEIPLLRELIEEQ